MRTTLTLDDDIAGTGGTTGEGAPGVAGRGLVRLRTSRAQRADRGVLATLDERIAALTRSNSAERKALTILS